MPDDAKPLVISAPDPRTLDLIFTPAALQAISPEIPHRRKPAPTTSQRCRPISLPAHATSSASRRCRAKRSSA